MTTLEHAQSLVRAHIKTPESLEFRKLSAYAITCKCCGKFYVTQVQSNGRSLFEVWFKADPSTAAQQLRQNLPTGVDAKNWASAIASAYKRGAISLKSPPTRAEIEAQVKEIDRLPKKGIDLTEGKS